MGLQQHIRSGKGYPISEDVCPNCKRRKGEFFRTKPFQTLECPCGAKFGDPKQKNIMDKQTYEAILIDQVLNSLRDKKVEIYKMETPKMIVRNGRAEPLGIDEKKHPLLSKINELINIRIEEIKTSFKTTRQL